MQIAELVARLAPRPDVPAKLRKLPQHDTGSRVSKASRPSIDPLSEARYRLQVTGSRAFRDKLFRVRDLMMHSNPSGDLAVVVERAIDELLEVLERRVFGKLSRKSAASSSPSSSATVTPRPAKVTAAAGDQQSANKKKKGGADRPGLARTSMQSSERTRNATVRGRIASRRVNGNVDLRQRKSATENEATPTRERSRSRRAAG